VWTNNTYASEILLILFGDMGLFSTSLELMCESMENLMEEQ
jgi:hypothetical protein